MEGGSEGGWTESAALGPTEHPDMPDLWESAAYYSYCGGLGYLTMHG